MKVPSPATLKAICFSLATLSLLAGCGTDPGRDPGLYYEGEELEVAIGDTTEALVFTKVSANARGQVQTLDNYTDVELHSDEEGIAGISGLRVFGVAQDSTTVWASDRNSNLSSRLIKVRVTENP